MTDTETSRPARYEVVIAGAGVAGLEAAFALRELAGDRVHVTLVSGADEYVERPLSVGEPFTASRARRYSLDKLAARAGADLVTDSIAAVIPARRRVATATGAELSYDALLVAIGARPHPVFTHATTVDDARMDELLHGLVQDVEGGYVRRLAIVVPAPMPWPLPAYELALMASERAWDMQADMDITLLTPERLPLEAFGDQAAHAMLDLLTERRIAVVGSAYCEVPRAKTVVVHPGGRTLVADRVIALPQLRGPELAGLPQDGGGFIPVDQYGRVRGADHVWAAGDATDTPLKHGGVGAQLADTAAASIAAQAGARVEVAPFQPVVEAVLMTGGTARHLSRRPATSGRESESVFSAIPRHAEPPKIATRYLGPELAGTESAAVAAST